MRSLNHIIETYRTADDERRLNLYLDCPTLREDFMEIETREASVEAASPKQSSFWKRFFSNMGILMG